MSHKLLTNLCSPEEQIKLEIKPGDKTKSHALDRDKWGNTRIVELLKEHEKERSRNPLKKYSGTSKRNVFTNQVRDKLQVDLK